MVLLIFISVEYCFFCILYFLTFSSFATSQTKYCYFQPPGSTRAARKSPLETTFLTIFRLTLCKTRASIDHRFFNQKVMFCNKYNEILFLFTSAELAFRDSFGEIFRVSPRRMIVLIQQAKRLVFFIVFFFLRF